jgi:hypothetical protein
MAERCLGMALGPSSRTVHGGAQNPRLNGQNPRVNGQNPRVNGQNPRVNYSNQSPNPAGPRDPR